MKTLKQSIIENQINEKKNFASTCDLLILIESIGDGLEFEEIDLPLDGDPKLLENLFFLLRMNRGKITSWGNTIEETIQGKKKYVAATSQKYADLCKSLGIDDADTAAVAFDIKGDMRSRSDLKQLLNSIDFDEEVIVNF